MIDCIVILVDIGRAVPVGTVRIGHFVVEFVGITRIPTAPTRPTVVGVRAVVGMAVVEDRWLLLG